MGKNYEGERPQDGIAFFEKALVAVAALLSIPAVYLVTVALLGWSS